MTPLKRWTGAILALVLQLSPLLVLCEVPVSESLSLMDRSRPDYGAYQAQHADAAPAGVDVQLGLAASVPAGGAETSLGDEGALYWHNNAGQVSFQVDVPASGLYQLEISYLPMPGHGVNIERDVLIDGELPFLEARSLVLHRAWERASMDVRQDNQGNDIRPALREAPQLLKVRLGAVDGLYAEPFQFYFSAGSHRIALRAGREPLAIHALRLVGSQEVPGYQEYLARHGEDHTKGSILLQGEAAGLLSDQSLYPNADVHNAATQPFQLGYTRMNYIGGYNWRMSGQFIEWQFDVTEPGLYQLSMRARQNSLIGMPVIRQMTLDGAVPYREINYLAFSYDTTWQIMSPRDQEGQPYLIYLDAGSHSLRLTVSMGELADIVRNVQAVSRELSQIYSRVIMITSTVPDPFRDYLIGTRLPGLTSQMTRLSGTLKTQVAAVEELAGRKVAEVQVLENMALQLDSLAFDPETLPSRLDRFRENLTALSSWVLGISEQPLDIDYILLQSREAPLPQANPTLAQGIANAVSSFGISFTKNYSNLGDAYEAGQALNVWVFMGREQANVVKAMIDDSFTPESGIPVNLNIVTNTNTLLFSASGGDPCDVAIGVGGTLPVDYGIRGALADLHAQEGSPDLLSRFKPEAFTPFQYDGKLYALPLTQSFPVMFYRQDILDALGTGIPDTWGEVYRLIALLQERNLNMAPGMFYEMFVLQNGGRYFSEDMSRCLLDAPQAVDAFERYTELFTHYGLPQAYDFYNRFRTGEMPIGIADFSMYNTLMVAAPEIKGLWGIAPVPGTLREDGSIDRTVAVSGSAAVIFERSPFKQEAFAFLDWLTSTPVQIRYGRELEAVLGLGARYFSANVEAVAGLSWPSDVYRVLSYQWDRAVGIPTVLGSYYISRHIGNAFREVVSLGELPRDAIRRYVEVINREMQKKREEFGLTGSTDRRNAP